MKISAERCGGVPGPDDAYESFPGLAFAVSMSSARFVTGRLLEVNSTVGDDASSVTGVKSRNGSYGT